MSKTISPLFLCSRLFSETPRFGLFAIASAQSSADWTEKAEHIECAQTHTAALMHSSARIVAPRFALCSVRVLSTYTQKRSARVRKSAVLL